MSKKCLRCGAELSDHAKFCDKCGTAVPDQPQTLYCQKCGAKLELGTKFCGNCGTPVGSRNSSSLRTAQERLHRLAWKMPKGERPRGWRLPQKKWLQLQKK